MNHGLKLVRCYSSTSFQKALNNHGLCYRRSVHSILSATYFSVCRKNSIKAVNHTLDVLLHKNVFPAPHRLHRFSLPTFSRSFQSKALKDSLSPIKPRLRTKKETPKNSSGKSSLFVELFKYGSFATCIVLSAFGLSGISEQQRELSKRRFFKYANLDEFMEDLNAAWNKDSRSKGHVPPTLICALGIMCVNAIVFLAWKVPSLTPAMTTWFTLSAVYGSRNLASTILSTFSHQSFLHLMVNMYVFQSFAYAWMAQEQNVSSYAPKNFMSYEKFMSFYLSAGVLSSVSSYLIKFSRGISMPSVGASGAIMGLIAYVCCKAPESRLSIVFLPQWSFTAEDGLKGVLLFDLCGLLLGFAKGFRSPLDHAGHLGGLLFGIWYAKGGDAYLYRWSRCVQRHWEKYVLKKP